MNIFNKKVNRISRLDDYRRNKNLTSNYVGNFEIEISPKALIKLKKSDKKIRFSFEHDFGINNKGMYWIRVDNEYSNKKTDFGYLAKGVIRNSQHNGGDNWGITVKFDHIDVSCNYGQLQALVEMLAIYIDKKYGNNCGFKERWNTDNMKIDFIKNKQYE